VAHELDRMVAGRTLIACSVCCSCRCWSLTDLRLLLLGGSTAFSYNPFGLAANGSMEPSTRPSAPANFPGLRSRALREQEGQGGGPRLPRTPALRAWGTPYTP